MAVTAKNRMVSAIGGESPTNGAAESIAATQPYAVTIRIVGSSDMLFHRWNVEGIDEKSKAAKGSKAKKTDDVESYVYRNADGFLCLPGEYLRQSIIHAAKFRQDPRSPRKSAMDLFKAGVTSLTDLGSLGVKEWSYEDRRRVMIQRNGITRTRPAMLKGWKAEFTLCVLLPEYIPPDVLHDTLTQAGKIVGVGDFRPTYGRFQVEMFDVGFDN